MIVIWTPEAEQDRLDIWNYIVSKNPSAAASMDELFSNAAHRLIEHPKLGVVGRVDGTRELTPHENYRIVYEIRGETIWIAALVHTSRLWPPTPENDA